MNNAFGTFCGYENKFMIIRQKRPSMSTEILLIGGSNLLRDGLSAILETVADLKVVGEAAGMDEAVLLTAQLHPDIVLMDTSRCGNSYIQTIRRLKENHPAVRVIVLIDNKDGRLLHDALTAGAGGFVCKDAKKSELFNAIQAARHGELYIHPSVTRILLNSQLPECNCTGFINKPLTRRETEVLGLIAKGYTNRQIADMICLSVRTVESHRASLLEKLNISSRVELVNYASNNGLLEGGKRISNIQVTA
jgi:two-component system, NarL family, response regulator NreC